MSKPDSRSTAVEAYPFSCRLDTRFTDLDPNGHINFAAMVALLGEGRGRFHTHIGRKELSGAVIVSMNVDYLAEVFYPEPLDVHLGVSKIGNTSWTFQQLALQNSRPVALCTSIMVMVEAGRAVLPAAWRTTLATYRMLSI